MRVGKLICSLCSKLHCSVFNSLLEEKWVLALSNVRWMVLQLFHGWSFSASLTPSEPSSSSLQTIPHFMPVYHNTQYHNFWHFYQQIHTSLIILQNILAELHENTYYFKEIIHLKLKVLSPIIHPCVVSCFIIHLKICQKYMETQNRKKKVLLILKCLKKHASNICPCKGLYYAVHEIHFHSLFLIVM